MTIESTKSTCQLRKPTNFWLPESGMQCNLRTTAPRALDLLTWLKRVDADSADLVDWLSGRGFSTYREEGPLEAILLSFEQLRQQQTFRNSQQLGDVLQSRVAEAFSWLIEQSTDGSIAWMRMIAMADQLGLGQSHPEVIRSILVEFDNRGEKVFPDDPGIAREFTKLVAQTQNGNQLKGRWINLIEGQEDKVLVANLFQAFRGLFSLPEMVEFSTLTESVMRLCEEIKKHLLTRDERRAKIQEFKHMVASNHDRYSVDLELILAGLWCEEYPWLPRPHPLLFTIAVNTDLAILAQLIKSDVSYLIHAKRMYEILSEQQLSAKMQAIISTRLKSAGEQTPTPLNDMSHPIGTLQLNESVMLFLKQCNLMTEFPMGDSISFQANAFPGALQQLLKTYRLIANCAGVA